MRRFESSYPSQAFQRRARPAKKCQIRPKIGAFYALGVVSRLPIRRSSGASCRKSPATSANLPVLRRLQPENWFDLHCLSDRAVLSTVFSSHLLVKSGVSEQVLHDDGSNRHARTDRTSQRTCSAVTAPPWSSNPMPVDRKECWLLLAFLNVRFCPYYFLIFAIFPSKVRPDTVENTIRQQMCFNLLLAAGVRVFLRLWSHLFYSFGWPTKLENRLPV
jgi:hypothetical protein